MTTRRTHTPADATRTEKQANHTDRLRTIRQEVDSLYANQQQDFAAFRAEMTAEFSALRAALEAESSGSTEPQEFDTPTHAATSRRALLKWGGLGAAALAATAGGSMLTSQTAHASDGVKLVLGNASNTAEHVTALTYNGSESTPVALHIASSANDSLGVFATAGDSVTAGSYGVRSSAGDNPTSYGLAALAGSDAVGVEGVAKGSGGFGVWGATDSGYAVYAASGSGIDLAASGTGRLLQHPVVFTGAPTTGTYKIGEQIRDALGDLYLCVSAGTPGLWKKVAALTTSYQGGAIGFLSTPIRVYDSRATGGPLVGNVARTIQVTGVTIGGVSVPKSATGCIGNLTVTGATKSGYVVIYPQGSATPSTSTVNFLAGQTVANAFAVGLSSGGAVTVHSFTSGQCQFIVDITGFVA